MKMIFTSLVAAICMIQSMAQNGPVVVELFTSQGCSSCPAADGILTEVLQQSSKDGRPVYGLSFHVDYWNYIGWKDPNSSKEFTDRQQKYAQEMRLRSIYTPQMIVNGKKEFVGSSRGELMEAIDEALGQKPSYQIAIRNMQVSNGVLNLQYVLDKEPNGELINIAIVENNAENYVPRGENSGRKLRHNNVVRSFSVKLLKHDQVIQLNMPTVGIEGASVVLYIQNKDLHILGATAKSI
jgi:hypothetical protein